MRDADEPLEVAAGEPAAAGGAEQLASAGELPTAGSGGGGDGGRSTDAATGAYRALLRQTLNGYTTSIPEDAAALEAGVRRRARSSRSNSAWRRKSCSTRRSPRPPPRRSPGRRRGTRSFERPCPLSLLLFERTFSCRPAQVEYKYIL